MARRVVSYSDIDDGATVSVASTSTLVAPVNGGSVSSSPSHDTVADGNDTSNSKGKRKRKGGKARQAASHKSPRIMGRDDSHQRGVHWDDPSYVPAPSGADQEEWMQEGPYAKHLDSEHTRQPSTAHLDDVEEFFDAHSDSSALESESADEQDGVEPVTEAQVAYTSWKYDENGDPYTGFAAVQGDEGGLEDEADDDEEDFNDDDEEAEEGSYDDESDDDDAIGLEFLVPDLDEFNHSWQAKHGGAPISAQSSSQLPSSGTAASQHQNRPPVEVGGGGRTLTHSEIWGPTAITDAWTAAMHEFNYMNDLTTPSTHPDAATDEPSKQRATLQDDFTHASALWHDAPGANSLLAKQIQLDTQQILQLKAQQKQKQKMTPPAAEVAPPVQPPAVAAPSKPPTAPEPLKEPHGGASGQTRVPSGKLPGNHAWKRAVKTVRNTPNSIGVPTVDKNETGNVDEKLLHEYWYAGYYAGLAQSQSQAIPQTAPAPNLGGD